MGITNISTLTALLAVVLTTDVSAKSVVVQLDAPSVTVRSSQAYGPYYVVNLPVPSEVIGKRLDTVLLEFYVDVAPDGSNGDDVSPAIEVLPLAEALAANGSPRFTTSHPSVRPLSFGEDRKVLVDVTDIVKGWIAEPSSNHGLIVGSFRGPKLGGLDVKSNVVAPGKVLQATFFYQNRFGQRVSH
jgi:hypothetical protein